MSDAPIFALALVAAATVGKVLGAGLPARISGMSNRNALAVGVGMNARGAVELVIADVAFRAGLFDVPDPPPAVVASLYSAIVLTAIVTTFATPVGLKWIYGRNKNEGRISRTRSHASVASERPFVPGINFSIRPSAR